MLHSSHIGVIEISSFEPGTFTSTERCNYDFSEKTLIYVKINSTYVPENQTLFNVIKLRFNMLYHQFTVFLTLTWPTLRPSHIMWKWHEIWGHGDISRLLVSILKTSRDILGTCVHATVRRYSCVLTSGLTSTGGLYTGLCKWVI